MVVDEDEIVEQAIVSGIAYSRDEAKITLRHVPDRPGVAAAIFGPLSAASVNVDMIVQNLSSEGTTDMTFTVGRADLARTQAILAEHAEQDRVPDGAGGPGRGEDQRGGGGDAEPCGGGEHDVRDAGGAGDQHPGDLDERDQGERADRGRIYRASGARAAHRLRSRCRLTTHSRCRAR